jgi:hypothetical protein
MQESAIAEFRIDKRVFFEAYVSQLAHNLRLGWASVFGAGSKTGKTNE